MSADTISPALAALPTSCSKATARRSLSVFSRKGYDAPSPTTQTLALASMSLTLAAPPPPAPAPVSSSMSKSKRWRLSRNAEPKIPEGTILRAVPKESPAQHCTLTALEREMATSPNEEILRNIGLMSAEPATPVEEVPTSPVVESPVAQRKQSKKERKNSQDKIIGVWKDGSVEWEAAHLGWDPAQTAIPEMDAPLRPKSADGIPASQAADAKKQRPKIQVVIPKSLSARRPYTHFPPPKTGSKKVVNPVSPPSVGSGKSIDSFAVSAVSPGSASYAPKPRRPAPMAPVIHAKRPASPSKETAPHAPEQSLLKPAVRDYASSSTTSASGDEDSGSGCRSNRSSMTSIGSDDISLERQRNRKSRSLSTSSITQVPKAPSFDVRTAISLPSGLGSPIEPAELEGSPVVERRQGPGLADLINIVRTPSTQRNPANRSFSQQRHLRTLVESSEEEEASPTLSEAERNLEAHLGKMSTPVDLLSTGKLSRQFSVRRKPVVSADAPPPPPPRSAKRRSMGKAPALSAADFARLANKTEPKKVGIARSSSVRSYLSLILEEEDRQIPADAAESVLYHILRNLPSLEDLFSMATINRGFYRVLKRHELDIIRGVMRTMSPAAWEYREACLAQEHDETDSAVPAPEYTAAGYYEAYKRDAQTLGGIKSLVLERCQSLLRTETVDCLTSHNPLEASRVDDALWRIWTFCRIFGCGRHREEDVIAQIDWLRGGPLAHQTACRSTISTSDSFYISSTLLNSPEHFAMGNRGGLTAEELYDMTEMWTCLKSITQGIVGRTEQARQHGVYDNTDIRGGDIDGEELMLEEWHGHLLTLGLDPILATAQAASSLYAFSNARRRGWTHWSAPTAGSPSRTLFLRDVVGRLYEERLCEAFSPAQSKADALRSIRRRRGETLADELRQRRAAASSLNSAPPLSSYKEMGGPQRDADDSDGLPSSLQQSPVLHPAFRAAFETSPVHDSDMYTPLPQPQHHHYQEQQQVQQLQPMTPASPIPTRLPPPPPPQRPYHPIAASRPPYIAPRRSSASHSPSVSSVSSTGSPTRCPPPPPPRPSHSPLPLHHPWQASAAAAGSAAAVDDPAQNSAEKAIFRIVEMGFTVDEAKGALKVTDMGDGLRVDRAVEYLLRTMEG